jgi:ribose 5-phosphate isomerase A
MSLDDAKQRAARAALDYLPTSGIVGLGSGSTAQLFIEEVAQLVAHGRSLVGVATSGDSRARAERLGIPLLTDDGPWEIAVTVDGADEVSDELDLIKGGGGCQTREKIVNQASALNIIVVDESKLSKQLGEKWPVPVEVLAFGHLATRERLSLFGPTTLRTKNGTPWLTDAGNYLYDVALGVMPEPAATDALLRSIPGVVETGLFCQRAQRVLVAGPSGVRALEGRR